MPRTQIPPAGDFSGFTKGTLRFFSGLRKNNTREWFESNRSAYETHVLAPAKAFVVAMGERLRAEVPGIIAVPAVNKSIFRLNRDTRFSLDPSPYKTNLGLYFWEGPKPRMECAGFYLHLEPPSLMLGGGFYMFPDHVLARFRRAVVDPKAGRELAAILADIRKRVGFEVGGQHYTRVPVGFDPSHPNAELLKHNGLYVGVEGTVPGEFYSSRLVDYCFERYLPVVPLHRWLVKRLG
jgi:uncharacterized protein (TIGR02453 family)